MKLEEPLPCIVCGIPPESAFPNVEGADPSQPYGATMFHTYGHYGSTVFDPQDNSQLLINVCDICLLSQKEYTWHVSYIKTLPTEVFSKPWDPDAEN